MDIVYAKQTVHLIGRNVLIVAGEAWDASDPIVKEFPGYFAADPGKVRSSRTNSGEVEQATAAPGEKRSTRRSRDA